MAQSAGEQALPALQVLAWVCASGAVKSESLGARKEVTREGRNARVCPGMKAACAAAAELVQGSAAGKGEVLRLLARRHCLEKGRVCCDEQ